MDMSTANVTQPVQTPKARKPRAPKDPNAQAEPKEPKARKPRQPKDPNAPPPEPKARKPRPPKAPKDPTAQAEPKVPKAPKAPKARKPRPPKVDITHAGPIHYHETDEPTRPPFVAVYSDTLEDDVPTKQRKTRSSGLDLSMANLRI